MCLDPCHFSLALGTFQRVDIANPPTLLLVVDSLLDRVTAPKAANTCANTAEGRQQCAASAAARDDENKAILKFLQDAYPALHEWVTWLRTSQKGGMGVMDGSSQTVIEDTFRWRGRVPSDEQKLITNTLASGASCDAFEPRCFLCLPHRVLICGPFFPFLSRPSGCTATSCRVG